MSGAMVGTAPRAVLGGRGATALPTGGMRFVASAIGRIFALATALCVATASSPSFAAKPYDAEIEYLDANATTGYTSYFDTGVLPADDVGALIRFSPKQVTTDSVLFGANSSGKTRWYFGNPGSTPKGAYFGRNTGNTSIRPVLATGVLYDVNYNHFNARSLGVKRLDGEIMTVNGTGGVNTNDFSLAIDTPWTCSGTTNAIHIFGHCINTGVHTGNGSWYRIYSAQFTRGGKIIKDLIPVRKDGVGYMYDKVSGELLSQLQTTNAAPAFALGGDVADESYVAGTVTLNADADWTSRGMLHFESDAVIDLNGHSLTIVGAFGTGTIRDSSSGTPGELHFVTPPFSEIESSLALTGNLKVVKEGEGSLALIRSGQTFTGGVVVAAGTAYAPKGANKNTYAESNSYWGPSGGTITVMPGATFDNKGNAGYATKQFILAGGTLANTGFAMSSFDAGIFSHLRLTADSYLDATISMHFWEQSATDAHTDLGGHTLTTYIGYSNHVYLNTVFSNGTLNVVNGGYLHPSPKSKTVVKHGSDTLNIRMIGSALNIGDDMPVRDYYAGYTQNNNGGTSKLLVHGTFTPNAVDEAGKDYFYGCTMQDGSCIDLSAKSNTWDTTSTGFTGGSRTVTFANGASVTIDIHGRELAKGEQVVSWTTPPSNLATLTFAWDAATTALGKKIFVTDEGIYYDIAETDVATASWTGAAGDNDTANPLNWACTNYLGGEVVGVPMGSTDVRISGGIALQINEQRPLACNSIYFDNVILTGDCDWSGLKEWVTAVASASITDIGSINLNGHTLSLVSTSISGTLYDMIRLAVTDNSSGDPGELHIRVPLSNSYLECNGFTISGNVRLVTEGSGWLAMTKAGQTFTGGVIVAEGTAYSPYQTHPESDLYWGAAGGTITVQTNATFDARGNTNMYYKNFVLNGGAIANTTSGMSTSNYGYGNVTLAADSLIETASSVSTLFMAPDGVNAKIDLAGHTLTITNQTSAHLYMHQPIVNGTIDTAGSPGGYIHIVEGFSGGSPTVNLNMGCAFNIAGEFSVSNYTARYATNYNYGSGTLKVYGTFTPVAQRGGNDAFFGPEMQDGSLIDLSGKTNGWSVVSTGFTGGNRTMTFADNATVGVLLGERKLKSETQVIDWSAAVPENRAGLKFYGKYADGRRVNLKVRDDGVYMPKKGMIIVFR
ncbi:MAG: hypothetical protein J6T51_02620 [Kiritimatiellae bacterium]|nr:hypothetical protein [Kiritimatiellia bacterium]